MTGDGPVQWMDPEKWFIDEETDQALASIDLALPPAEAPAGLWARIAPDLEAPHPLAEGLMVSRLDEGRWRQLAPGVKMKRMWNKLTWLLRCEPGSTVPAHEHRSFEHALVISGDLVSNLGTYGPGDYHGVPSGGVHDAWTTRTGCLVLIQYEAA
jgi:anti-sigma factor ChrR (cupin superfamily)